MSGTLHLIAVPLGNIEDLSPRARRLLAEVDVLYSEDTRTAQRLLSQVDIARKTLSCFDANESGRAQQLTDDLAIGKSVGLISEAGTPAISDPGYRMVQAAIEAGATVVPVPGPAALICALIASGLATDRFYFGGFLPRKSAARRATLTPLLNLQATLIFYESPMRTGATLLDALAVLGNRKACVARELSKTHEDFVRADLKTLAEHYRENRPLGEITLVIAGCDPEADAGAFTQDSLREKATALLQEGYSVRDVTQMLMAQSGHPRREIYPLVLAAKG